MKKFNRLVFFLAIFPVMLILLAGCGSGKKEAEPDTHGRVLQEVTIKPAEFEVNTVLADLLNPRIVAGDGSSFYVYDDADKIIYRFKPDGELINTIGEGEGRGPGEVLNVSSISIDEDHVWVLDSGQASLLKFRKSGEFLGVKALKGQAIRALAAKGDKLVVMNMVNSELFTSMSKGLADEKTNTFGAGFLKNQEQNVVSTFGTMLAQEKGGFVYVPAYANRVYYYNAADSLEFMKVTPGGQDFQPSVIRTDEQGRMAISAPHSEFETAAAALSEGRLYLAVKHNVKENAAESDESKAEYFMDVFSAEDAAYQYSFRVPVIGGYSGMVFFGNTLITIAAGDIVKYETNLN